MDEVVEAAPRKCGSQTNESLLKGAQALLPPLVKNEAARLPAQVVGAQGVMHSVCPFKLTRIELQSKRLKNAAQCVFRVPHQIFVSKRRCEERLHCSTDLPMHARLAINVLEQAAPLSAKGGDLSMWIPDQKDWKHVQTS